MRAKFSILKPYKMFKGLNIVFDTKRKQYENSVLIFSESEEETINIINSRLFDQQHIRCFYMEKFLDKMVYKRLVQTDRIEYYKKLKENTNLTLMPLNLGVLKDKNTYYPCFKDLKQMYLIPGAKNKAAFINHFTTVTNLLKHRGNEPFYKKQYVIVDSNIFGKEFGESESDRIKGLCTGSLFYLQGKMAITEKNSELWPFAGRNVILFDSRSSTSFPIPADISTLTLAKFRWMLNIMHKLSVGKPITSEDLAEEEAPSVEEKAKQAGKEINTSAADKAKVMGFVVSSSKTYNVEKNSLAYETEGEAFVEFCKAEYPDVSVSLNDNTITIMMDEGTPALAKALYTEKLSVFKTEGSINDKDIFEKVNGAYKAKKSVKTNLLYSIAVKKSGDKIGKYKLTLEVGTDHPVITKAKNDVLKKVEGMKNAIPLSTEQRELVYSIQDRVEELSQGKDLLNPAEFLQDLENDETIKDLSNKLNASRLLSVQNKRASEVIDKLEDKQRNASLKINGKDTALEEKLKSLETIALKPIEFPKIDVLNKEMNKSSARALRESYKKDLYEYDQYRIFTNFSKASDIPIFVESIERTDSSTAFTAKETLNIKFNIAGEKPKSMQIDVPIIDQDGYLYIQGSRKQVTNQITMMPITKVMQSGELVVQYCTSYNKIFLSRSSGNFSRGQANIFKAFDKLNSEHKLSGNGYKILMGRSTETNDGIDTSLEFYELSKKIISVAIDDMRISFSKKIIEEIAARHNIELDSYKENFPPEKYHFIGVLGKQPLFESTIEGVYAPNDEKNPERLANSIAEFIRACSVKNKALEPIVNTELYSGSSFSYTKLEVSNAYIPLLVFLGFKDGLEELFDRYEIKYVFVPKEGRKNYDIPPECTERVPFKDGTMYFESVSVKKNLLAFGIYQLPTADFSIRDFAADGEGYYQYFMDKVTPRYGKALQNFYTLFIDPITADILRDHSIPDDITGSFLYCNDLLQDAAYNHRYDMKIYRIRNLECINAMLYKLVARQIEKYRRGSRGDTAGTLAVRKDALFMEINDAPNFEDSTILNPVKESENLVKAIYKGPGAPAYSHIQGTEEHRYFDKSQRGIYGLASSYDGNAGMNRRLSMNTMITSKRGYLHTDEPASNLDATNLFSLGDLSQSFTPTHADPPRAMMAVAQTGHQIPTVHMNHSLISTGAFKVLPHFVSNEFAFKAQDDGVCLGVDPKDKYIINLKYKDGSRGIIDTSTKYRRSPDGFFINIDLKPCIKKGDHFKKDEILAYDEHFFMNGSEGIEMMKGTLAKVAIVSRDITLEDSSCISSSLADKLASSIVMETTLTLSPQTNLIDMASVGQEIKTSENLAVFEEHLDDIDVGKALDKLGTLEKSLASISQNTKTSKYTGKIVDIEIFYNHPIEEYSPSLQKLIKAYIEKSKAKEENLASVRRDQFIRRRDLEPQKNNKAKGVPFDGVLINFYTKIEEAFAVGDKLTYDVSLKAVVGEIIDSKVAPTSEYDDHIIDGCLSPFSVFNRKVPDFLFLLYTNKILVSLKKHLKEMIE